MPKFAFALKSHIPSSLDKILDISYFIIHNSLIYIDYKTFIHNNLIYINFKTWSTSIISQ